MTMIDTRSDLRSARLADDSVDEDEDRGLAERLADMTAIAEMLRSRAENLAIALDSNREIGTAIGLIMAQYKLSHQAAFNVLIKLSQNSNCKIRDLTVQIIQAQDDKYAKIASTASIA